jgi:hypothetical protein
MQIMASLEKEMYVCQAEARDVMAQLDSMQVSADRCLPSEQLDNKTAQLIASPYPTAIRNRLLCLDALFLDSDATDFKDIIDQDGFFKNSAEMACIMQLPNLRLRSDGLKLLEDADDVKEAFDHLQDSFKAARLLISSLHQSLKQYKQFENALTKAEQNLQRQVERAAERERKKEIRAIDRAQEKIDKANGLGIQKPSYLPGVVKDDSPIFTAMINVLATPDRHIRSITYNDFDAA